MVDRAHVANWIAGYEDAWRTAGTAKLSDLFLDEATYSMGPYEPTVHGIDAIAELWERERVSADESFTMTWDFVVVEGDTGVARLEVHYHDTGKEYRDLWII